MEQPSHLIIQFHPGGGTSTLFGCENPFRLGHELVASGLGSYGAYAHGS